jgi:dTDP-4-dehydrorhamnose reductase
MSILITGANGQVGHELAARAPEAIPLGRRELDLSRGEALLATLRRVQPAIVINAAAYTAVDKAEQEAEAAFAANRDGVAVLARGCKELGIPLLHLSTDYVFDGAKQGPYTEADPTSPQGTYGRSKCEGEERLRAILDRHIILRVSWVFGAHGANFVKTMLRLAKTHPALRVVADQHGGPTPAGDIAETLLALARRYLERNELPWGTYHYSGAPATTWHGFASAVVERGAALGLIPAAPPVNPITTADYPLPAPRPANSVFDCGRAEGLFGLRQPDWRQGLEQVLKRIQQQNA